VLADVDAAKEDLAAKLGARWMSPFDALRADVDVLAPCALGGMIDEALVRELRCSVICGAANNQLADDGIAAQLAARDVLYAPDFVVNAAGLINASLELTGYDLDTAQRRAAGIEQELAGVLDHARATGETPLQAAVSLADRRLVAATVAPAA
jgi:leucine dehydrogenase